MTQAEQHDKFQHYPLPHRQLPAGWALVCIDDIAGDVRPGFASGRHNLTGSGVPHLRPMNIDRLGRIDMAVTKSVAAGQGAELTAGDVLFNNTNSPELVGKTTVISKREQGHAFSNHMTRLRVEPGVSPAFVAAQLHFLWMSGYLRQRCTNHVNQASISSNTLGSSIPLLLPPPEEQNRVAESIELLMAELDIGVAELHAAQRKLTVYRQSVLKAAVEGSLTAGWRDESRAGESTEPETGEQLLKRILVERRAQWEATQLARFDQQGSVPPKDWRGKYPEPVSVRADELSALPKGWAWASAEQLCGFITKGTTPPTGQDQGGLKTVPFLRVTNLSQDGSLDLSNQVRVSDEVHRGLLARSIVYPGDVLMNIVGPPLGQVSVVPATFPEWNINQAIAVFRAVDGVLPAWLCLCLLSPATLRWLRAQAKTTAGQTNLTLEVCRGLPVPLPPTAVQSAIAEAANGVLAEITGLESATSHGLRLVAAQRRNLLKGAFSGQLVPQDPADEPASALLARIQATRAARATSQAPKSRLRQPAGRTRTSAC